MIKTAYIKYTVYLLYGTLLIYLVFLHGDDHRHLNLFSLDNHVNLIPGKEKYHFFTHRELWPGWNRRFYIKELIANFLLLVPIPIFLILGEGRINFKKVILTGFLVSLSIEITQFLLGIGTADIDDLFLNTLGIIVATACCSWIIKRKWWITIKTALHLSS